MLRVFLLPPFLWVISNSQTWPNDVSINENHKIFWIVGQLILVIPPALTDFFFVLFRRKCLQSIRKPKTQMKRNKALIESQETVTCGAYNIESKNCVTSWSAENPQKSGYDLEKWRITTQFTAKFRMHTEKGRVIILSALYNSYISNVSVLRLCSAKIEIV